VLIHLIAATYRRKFYAGDFVAFMRTLRLQRLIEKIIASDRRVR